MAEHESFNSVGVVGTDEPADSATSGYLFNHVALVVKDVDASMDFYGRVLGMRHMFTYHSSSEYQIVYMCYPRGREGRTEFQTGEELLKEKTSREGLLEFIYYKGSTKPPEASTTLPNTFSHIGLVVPDVQAFQKRMEENNVPIIKPVGQKPQVPNDSIANAFGLGAAVMEARKAALAGIMKVGFEGAMMVTDPDGNIVEVLPQS